MRSGMGRIPAAIAVAAAAADAAAAKHQKQEQTLAKRTPKLKYERELLLHKSCESYQ